MTLPFKVEYAIVCDLVRREDSGKLIIVGVYGDSILINEFPATFMLAVTLRIAPQRVGTLGLDFRATMNTTEIVTGEANIEVENLDRAFVNLGPFPLGVTAPGNLRFEMREKSKRWTLLTEMTVALREPS